jgi:hypothetical protein
MVTRRAAFFSATALLVMLLAVFAFGGREAATAAALGPASTVTKADADRMLQKINVINKNGLAARPAARRTTVTEREVNAYLNYHGREELPPGLVDPVITIVGDGRLSGHAVLDLDTVRAQRSDRGWLDPLAYLGGKLPVRVTGVLNTNGGKGRFLLETAEVGGVSVPKTVVQDLVTAYSRLSGHGVFDIDAPFELPARIREIRVGKGEAVVVQ